LDDDRIKSLIASISRAFPVGALMSLDTGRPVNFKPRPVEGAPPEAKDVTPQSLLLDGQQRMTSLYQVTLRGRVVETVTPKKRKSAAGSIIDIRKALDPSADREEAIPGAPEDKIERTDFGREIKLDLSNPQQEYASLMYPVSQVFDWAGGKMAPSSCPRAAHGKTHSKKSTMPAKPITPGLHHFKKGRC
jgi:hypothetical protein